MQSSQVYTKSAMQLCSSGEPGGETGPNAAVAGPDLESLPGFSPEQVASLSELFLDILSDPTPLTPLAKKKRNQKTRNQYKKKAQSQAQRVTIQMQEVDSIQISAKKVSKHVVLHRKAPWDWMATSWHAVISYVGMASFIGTIMVQNGVICMRRMGVG